MKCVSFNISTFNCDPSLIHFHEKKVRICIKINTQHTHIHIFYIVTCTNKSTTWLYLFIKHNRLKMFWYNFFSFIFFNFSHTHIIFSFFCFAFCLCCDNMCVCVCTYVLYVKLREFIDVLLLSRRWLIIQDLCLVTQCRVDSFYIIYVRMTHRMEEKKKICNRIKFSL